MGQLTLITTPIGNLSDLTDRARDALLNLKYFAVEDTRSFSSLMSHLGISLSEKVFFSFHDHSSEELIDKVLSYATNDGGVGVVSEAGSPIVSDPAYPLVCEALKRGYQINSTPGVTAVVSALELSGLPPTPFHFYGFLPRDDREKMDRLAIIGEVSGTHIFFESPHRILSSMELISDKYPDADVVIARELTKKFETIYRFKGSAWPKIREEFVVKGEIVLLINHKRIEQKSTVIISEKIKQLIEPVIESGGATKPLSKLLSTLLDRPSSEIYDDLLSKKRGSK